MKNIIKLLCLSSIALCCFSNVSFAQSQSATLYKSVDLGIQFQIPDNLLPVLSDAMFNPFQDATHFLKGKSPDKTAYLFVFAYENTNVKDKKFLELALNQLGHKEPDQFKHYPSTESGFQIYRGYTIADKTPIVDKPWGPIEINSQKLGVHVVTAEKGANSYIFYLFCDASLYKADSQEVINLIGTLAKI